MNEFIDIEHIVAEVKKSPHMRRFHLLSKTLLFTKTAQQYAGITRIALIGSLATNKRKPKDVDMLVTVTEETNLAPLAKLGRKLNGEARDLGSAGEVFLANPQGEYLGRTCPRKKCGPGDGKYCTALHCGRRPYLHDDLKTLELPKTLIANPPLELWPTIINRMPIMLNDIHWFLILPLQGNVEFLRQFTEYLLKDGEYE